MPHSGGGGSHSSGGHHSGGGHHSSGSHSSGGKSVTVSSKPFVGCHTYAVYDKAGKSRLVYTDSGNYHAEVTKAETVASSLFGAVFMLPGIGELIGIIVMLISAIHLGVKPTPIPSYADSNIVIQDSFDLVSDEEEALLGERLEEFRDKTGIIPSVEFTYDDYWMQDYSDLESFAYNEYVCNFFDENHLLIVYSYGYVNSDTGFNEFNWESMWGDDLGKTASRSDEDTLADIIQDNLTRANGKNVAKAIAVSFDEFYEKLDTVGFKIETEKIFVAVFLLVHGGLFFFAGFLVIRSSIKKYLDSQKKGEKTYKIKGEPEIMRCDYCGTSYYKGTVGNCPNCAAPLDNMD